jgi:hypothetical protein
MKVRLSIKLVPALRSLVTVFLLCLKLKLLYVLLKVGPVSAIHGF